MLALSIACTVAAAAWAYLVLGHGRFWLAGEWLPPGQAEPDSWPEVVAVVPARNEAAMLPVTLPTLLGQDYPGALSVVLVDDCSSDGTGEVAAKSGLERAAAAGDPGQARAGSGRDLGGQGVGHGPGRGRRGRAGVRAVHRRRHRLGGRCAARPGDRRRGR